jgi:hypothetical protein
MVDEARRLGVDEPHDSAVGELKRERRNGPMIHATHVEQVEILPDGGGSQVYVVKVGERIWLQGELVGAGLARARAHARGGRCAQA